MNDLFRDFWGEIACLVLVVALALVCWGMFKLSDWIDRRQNEKTDR